MRTSTLSALKNKLDKVFSRHIRQKYANQGGWAECVTCKRMFPWEDMHAGHFVRRRHMAVRWDERNVHPQCCHCNTFLDGNEGEYARYILDRYGRETLDELLNAKNITRKWTRAELLGLLEQYT